MVRTKKVIGWFGDTYQILFGILAPLIALSWESVSHPFADMFFDPIPSFFHQVLLALVPLTQILSLLRLKEKNRLSLKLLMALNAASIAVAAFFSLAFAPVTPLAVIAVMYLGMGLMPLSPLLSLFALLFMRRRLKKAWVEEALPGKAGLWLPLAAGLLAFVLAQLPNTLTSTGLDWYGSEDKAIQQRGIKLLRSFGSKDQLLRRCYSQGNFNPMFELGSLFLDSETPSGPETAREAYYRAYGQPFNQLAAPASRGRGRNEFRWDQDQGGSVVGGRASDLSLFGSRLDGSLDPKAALGYLQWTVEFKNQSPRNREARAQILLPPGAVVSRLTLWVDGEEREAAFAEQGKVRRAYQKVVQAQRDPVLVTAQGLDRVLMQCFPVPPGGTMKVRLGISLPLLQDEKGNLTLRWPAFRDRNFSIPDGLKHAAWLESKSPFLGEGAKNSWREELADKDLDEPSHFARFPGAQLGKAWSEDPLSSGGFVTQDWGLREGEPRGMVVVLDNSASLASLRRGLEKWLEALPEGLPLSLVAAKDIPSDSGPLAPLSAQGKAGLRKMIRDMDFEGGQDNLPALARAWDLATAGKAKVLWIHGPQPMALGSNEALLQRSERSGQRPPLLAFEAAPGLNLVLEKLEGGFELRQLPRLSTLEEDLERILRDSAGAVPLRRRSGIAPAQGEKTSAHLARLWAGARVRELLGKGGQGRRQEALQLAMGYHLVTPVSGAVVLETKQQFQAEGLEPVKPGSVPVVPEPEAIALALLSLACLAVLLHKRRPSWSLA